MLMNPMVMMMGVTLLIMVAHLFKSATPLSPAWLWAAEVGGCSWAQFQV